MRLKFNNKKFPKHREYVNTVITDEAKPVADTSVVAGTEKVSKKNSNKKAENK